MDVLRPEIDNLLHRSYLRSRFDARFHDKWDPNCAISLQGCHGVKAQIVSGMHVAKKLDVTIYVGKNRTPYVQSIDTLRGSSYFRAVLEKMARDSRGAALAPIVLDCEESVFQNMICILRYGSFKALPKMSTFEMFKLRKELEFYGIEVCELTDDDNSAVGFRSLASSHQASRTTSPDAAVVKKQHFCLSDPATLVLVSRLDGDVRGRCPCAPKDKPSQWALNFHHRHSFCTGCGNPALGMATKCLAEMFMVAASYYTSSANIDSKKWFVGCDSSCTLKFFPSTPCCGCSCSRQNVWAVSTYHSHAFCTHCGKCAKGSILVFILLAVRYGGHRVSHPRKSEIIFQGVQGAWKNPVCIQSFQEERTATDQSENLCVYEDLRRVSINLIW